MTRMALLALCLTVVQAVLVVSVGRVPDLTRPIVRKSPEAMLVLDAAHVENLFAGVPRSRRDVFGRDPDDPIQAVALRSLPRPEYRVAEWREPTRWLTNPSTLQAVRVPDVKPSALELTATRPRVPATWVRSLVSTQTLIEVHGRSEARRWKLPPTLGPWTGSELLGSTRLDVAVNPQGSVVLSQVSESSGSRAADEQALEAVRKAQFQPVPGAGRRPEFGSTQVEWVTVNVHWATQPLLR
jgi:TonB family protein